MTPTRAFVLSAAAALACGACSSSSNAPNIDAPVSHDGPSDRADVGPEADGGDGADAPGDGPAPPTLTAAFVKAIDLPGIPVGAAYNAGTKKAYFACVTPAGASAGVAVVDDVQDEVVATITPAAAVSSLAADATTKVVYAAEGAAIEVIDSARDVVAKTVTIPDGSIIAGLAVDESHDKTYVVTTGVGGTELFVLDGPTATLTSLRQPLLAPVGMPVAAVDGPTQQLFILGNDSQAEGLVVTLDAPSGVPTHVFATPGKLDPAVSGVVLLGGGGAALLAVSPGVVEGLMQGEFTLPAAFKPAGVTAADLGQGPIVLVAGLRAGGGLEGLGVDTSTGGISPFQVPLAADLPASTTAARLLTAAPVSRGSEVYVTPTPDPKSGAAYAPAQALKLIVTSTGAPRPEPSADAATDSGADASPDAADAATD
ncbi:MAG TPA: hypothetical protein VHL80_03090 [Polyangia bacterium]|nr:hypothetical protein [Polyangia bacterium]